MIKKTEMNLVSEEADGLAADAQIEICILE